MTADMTSPGGVSASLEHRPVTVLFLIDQLCGIGGAERALLKIVQHLPRERFRPIVSTFQYNPEFPGTFLAPLHVLPLARTYDINALKVARSLRRLIREENVQIVHTFFETSDLWGGMIAKLSGCQVLISSRRDMGIQRNWKHYLAYKIIGRLVDQVQTVSEEVRQFTIRQDSLPPHRVVTVYTGVDLNSGTDPLTHGELCGRLGVPATSPIVITVANIRPIKGIDTLIRAADLVRGTHPEAVFVIVGDAADKDYSREMQNLVNSLGLSGSVRFWGPDREVSRLLSAADIFTLLSNSEGFSNALVEAMACGLPCVASDVGGNAEAIRNGENGYVTARGDYRAAAERIGALLDDPDERRRMGKAGREVVDRQFTTAAMVQRLTSCYEALLQ